MRADEAFVAWNDAQDDHNRPTLEDAYLTGWLASRKAALEEAAKVCGGVVVRGDIVTMELTAQLCADAILALANRPEEG